MDLDSRELFNPTPTMVLIVPSCLVEKKGLSAAVGNDSSVLGPGTWGGGN